MKQGPITAEFSDGVPTMGGARWLDLVNSRFVWNGEPVDFLADEAGFVKWLAALGAAPGPDITAERRELVALRQSLASSFDAIASGGLPPSPCLELLNRLLARLAIKSSLAVDADHLHLLSVRAIQGPQVAVEIAEEFARMLATIDYSRLRHCENPACDMVFHDYGKNNRRRWCSTSICGNRDKVKRYRQRKNQSV